SPTAACVWHQTHNSATSWMGWDQLSLSGDRRWQPRPWGTWRSGCWRGTAVWRWRSCQARGLTMKSGSKTPPAAYIKVYLLENGVCVAKKKTKSVRKSLDPLYNQVLVFPESPQGKVVQLIVWGNYGRMDRKCFMGVARILLEELDLSTMVIGWYKLFPTSSMVDPKMAPLIRHSSQMSLESTLGPCSPAPREHLMVTPPAPAGARPPTLQAQPLTVKSLECHFDT
ncbi:hypothetical protein fugu_005488, partial [Takifugu bimaculatus]